MKPKKKIVFIVGPTGVGKTTFSIELARRISGQIVSSDSMQAYRWMDIISQKPTKRERAFVPHHLIDIVDPSEEYSAAEFVMRATASIEKIIEEEDLPIVVGGSGLYIKALIDGLFPSPKKDPSLRKDLELEAARRGTEVLHGRLKGADPETASKVHPNDLRRIIRALEVFHLTGIPISEHKKRTKGIKDRFDVLIFGLIRPRKDLYKRVEDRIDKMFGDGLVEEISSMRRKKPSITASASLGYKEVIGYLDREYSFDDAKTLLAKNTRRLAKKQMAWFNADRRIRWIDLDRVSQGEAMDMIERGLKIR